MKNEFYARIRKQHLVLVLGIIGIAATLSIAAILAFPVRTALSDHTGDDVLCPSTHCVGAADIGGSAITSAKIRNGAVKTQDIADQAITQLKIASGAVKLVVTESSAQKIVSGGSVDSLTAICGVGETVTGGGHGAPSSARILSSHLSTGGNGWSVSFFNTSGSSIQVFAYAECAHLTP